MNKYITPESGKATVLRIGFLKLKSRKSNTINKIVVLKSSSKVKNGSQVSAKNTDIATNVNTLKMRFIGNKIILG